MNAEPDNADGTVDLPPAQPRILIVDSQSPPSTVETGSETINHGPGIEEPADAGSSATISVAGQDLSDTGNELPTAPRMELTAAVQAAAPPGYEILGVLGRGGMGVVYDARQRALKRRVALKMVTAGVHSDPAQAARFQIEAEAVAALQHPNIVQIHEVGEHLEIPYFSLELVDGGSLEARIKREPLSIRESAEMVCKLAEAMHYAHQNGIVHRDLKPGNVLLTAAGQPKISDFGLAKRIDDNDSSQTQAGTILGTPSYMSPEQADGDIAHIGPSTDVYALGAVLYRLLTSQPPFQGATLMETIEAVRTREPKRVRELQPKVPRDLETICLTCLQKATARRYADADALARDLKHFLAGEPIDARPVGTVERAWRWCQRNPIVASLAAAVFALLATVAITSSVLLVRVAKEKDRVQLAQVAAEEARDLAQENETKAVAAEKKAQENAQLATKQSGLALQAIRTLIREVQQQIGDSPGMQPLKAKLLETALDELDKVAKSDEHSRLLGQTIAGAYMQMGQLFRQLGQTEKAYAQYLKCHEIIKSLAERDPDGDTARVNLAATFGVLGEMSLDLKRDLQASRDYYQRRLDIYKDLVGRPQLNVEAEKKLDPAKVKQGFAESYTLVGVTYIRLGEPERALEYFRQAQALRQELVDATPTLAPAQADAARTYRLDLARSYNALAEVRFRTRDWDAARTDFTRAVAEGERVHREQPENPQYRRELSNTLGNLGLFDVRTGKLDEAQATYDRYFAITRELAELDPKNSFYQRSYGLANYRLATLARLRHDAETARRCNLKCLEVREKLAAEDAKNERRRLEVLLVLPRCGEHARAAEEAARLLSSGSTDREVLFELAQCYAQCAAAVPGDPGLRTAYTDKAIDALTRAIDQGFKDRVILETEPDLDGVRDHPRFRELVARLRPS